MTIIEDLRYAADNPDVFEHDYPAILRRIADRLERSGALVPVPDGEACAIMDCDSRYFIYNGRVYEIPDGEFYGVLVGHEGPHYTGFYGDSATIVQPVRLERWEEQG